MYKKAKIVLLYKRIIEHNLESFDLDIKSWIEENL